MLLQNLISLISASRYKECYSSTLKSCSLDFKIDVEKGDNMDLSKCIDLCNENTNCKFVQLAKHSEGKIACRMYSSCYMSRVSNWPGTTYSKDGICPGKKIIKTIEHNFK